MSKIDETIDKYVAEAEQYSQEENMLDEMAKGWDKSSVAKFGKTIGKDPGEHGFFAACVTRMKKHDMKDPEGFCAQLIDKYKGTTMWRTGPKGHKGEK